jgi:hypothetical protein
VGHSSGARPFAHGRAIGGQLGGIEVTVGVDPDHEAPSVALRPQSDDASNALKRCTRKMQKRRERDTVLAFKSSCGAARPRLEAHLDPTLDLASRGLF